MLLVILIFIEMCIGYFRFNKVGQEIDIGLKFKYVVVYCILFKKKDWLGICCF